MEHCDDCGARLCEDCNQHICLDYCGCMRSHTCPCECADHDRRMTHAE